MGRSRPIRMVLFNVMLCLHRADFGWNSTFSIKETVSCVCKLWMQRNLSDISKDLFIIVYTSGDVFHHEALAISSMVRFIFVIPLEFTEIA